MESLWAKNGPKKSAFKFGVGGTDETIQITGTPLQLMLERIQRPKNQTIKMIDLID